MDDPSEYEGTVQRQEGALSAGVLEKLLEKAQAQEPKFQYIDFGKEVLIIIKLYEECIQIIGLKIFFTLIGVKR